MSAAPTVLMKHCSQWRISGASVTSRDGDVKQRGVESDTDSREDSVERNQ